MLFGLPHKADPAETLGFEKIEVRGFSVGDFLGSYSDVFEATANDVIREVGVFSRITLETQLGWIKQPLALLFRTPVICSG